MYYGLFLEPPPLLNKHMQELEHCMWCMSQFMGVLHFDTIFVMIYRRKELRYQDLKWKRCHM